MHYLAHLRPCQERNAQRKQGGGSVKGEYSDSGRLVKFGLGVCGIAQATWEHSRTPHNAYHSADSPHYALWNVDFDVKPRFGGSPMRYGAICVMRGMR